LMFVRKKVTASGTVPPSGSDSALPDPLLGGKMNTGPLGGGRQGYHC
jgi:hypothetical protein